jgi:hypothetical protein
MTYLVLKYNLVVPEVFFYALLHQVEEIYPAMIPGEIYELKVLCGKDFWSLYTNGQKKTAGKCMVHMVENGMLPLHFAKGRHEYPKLYSLR